MECGLTLCCVGGEGLFAFVGVREKWYLRCVVGPRSIQNTDKYLCKFSVPRGGVEKTGNEKQKNRNADKGAHDFPVSYLYLRL